MFYSIKLLCNCCSLVNKKSDKEKSYYGLERIPKLNFLLEISMHGDVSLSFVHVVRFTEHSFRRFIENLYVYSKQDPKHSHDANNVFAYIVLVWLLTTYAFSIKAILMHARNTHFHIALSLYHERILFVNKQYANVGTLSPWSKDS